MFTDFPNVLGRGDAVLRCLATCESRASMGDEELGGWKLQGFRKMLLRISFLFPFSLLADKKQPLGCQELRD